MTRAYLEYMSKGPINAEYDRAKNVFCRVLGVDEATLFPPTFTFTKWFLGNQQNRKDIELALPRPSHSSCRSLNPNPSSARADEGLGLRLLQLEWLGRGKASSMSFRFC